MCTFDRAYVVLLSQTLTQGNNLPLCAVPGPSSQFVACGGQSCTTSGTKNFTLGCQSIGGFVSGTGQLPFCAVANTVNQFTACPAGTSVCEIEPGFETACTKLGGFIDGYLGPGGAIPECASKGALNWFKPCNGSCTFSSTAFTTGALRACCRQDA